MSNPSRALTSRLDWRKVFVAIELDGPRHSVLPQAFSCPLCQAGAMMAMDDPVLHTQWFYCSGCEFAGDLIELASGVLGCSIGSAVDLLESRGLFDTPLCDDDIAIYNSQQVEYRQRIRTFWDTAKRAPSQTASVLVNGRQILRHYGLSDVYPSEWLERGGKLFGITQRKVVEDLFAPLSFETQSRENRQGRYSPRRGGGPGNRRLFERADGDEILVIGHCDLPGRVIGFTFMGGDPDNPQTVYKRVNLGCCVSRPRESGFGFLETVSGVLHPSFGRQVFVFLDPEVTIRLHAQNLRASYHPLPVLLARSTGDFRPLHLPLDLEDRELIFCGPLLDTLPLAEAHNGAVSLYQIPESEVRDNLQRRDPVSFLWQFQKRATPWAAAVRHQLLSTSIKPQQSVLLDRLPLSPRESAPLQQGLGGVVGERFADLTPHRVGGKQIPVGAFTVEETPEGWLARKPGSEQLICNRPIRVETIYRSESGDAAAYGIAVQRANDTVRLVATAREIQQSSLFGRVSDELWNGFHEHLKFVRHKWAKLSLSLALQFSQPEIIPNVDRVGWNPSRQRFQFPKFSILIGGEVDPTPMPIVRNDHPIPGAALVAPYRCRQAVAMLSRTASETQLIWALAACVSHNLLAGHCTREPVGVVLDGRYAQETGGRAAKALGCGSVFTDARRNGPVLRFVSTHCGAHDFPSVVDLGGNSRPVMTTDWIDDPQLRRAILLLPTRTAITVGLQRGFVRIRSHELPLPLGPLESTAGWIIPAYLEDVCRRKMQTDFRPHQHEIVSVLHDMAEWLERCGGDPQAVLAGEKLLVVDSVSPALAFVELVEWMRSRGDLATMCGPTKNPLRSKAPVAIIESSGNGAPGEQIQVSLAVINEILQQKRAPAIRADDIQADLETLSAWGGITEADDHGSAWLIHADWWKQAATAIRRKLRSTPPVSRKVSIDGPTVSQNLDEASEVCSESPPSSCPIR